MKRAVMIGAGNIGRGFIGKVFSEAGYEVVFIDVIPAVVEQLNRDREYPVRLVSNEEMREVMVKNVRAVYGMNTKAVAEEIAHADIMATAVGVNALPHIIGNIAAGLDLRAALSVTPNTTNIAEHCELLQASPVTPAFPEKSSMMSKASSVTPLDIIICENLLDADAYLRGLLQKAVKSETLDYLENKVGLVEASIGRMVPVVTEAMREGNPLRIWAEPYEELPVDKDAFRGVIPSIKNLVPFSPFGFYIRRKLFIHNMGHALCAYFGWLKGYTYIYEAAADAEIAARVQEAMLNVAEALHRDYGIPLCEIEANVYDLIRRFGNRVLQDSIARVGKDPVRKLKSIDRLTGAALYCIAQGTSADSILPGIAAALRFTHPDDDAAAEIQHHIAEHGIKSVIQAFCGIYDEEITVRIADEYDRLKP